MEYRITSQYLNKLQWIYHGIDNRGICVSKPLMKEALIFINDEINKNLAIASKQWGTTVYCGKANEPTTDNCVNINSSSGEKALLKKMQEIGYKVPKITKRDSETGEYEAKFSTGELSLQKMLVTDQFNFRATVGSDPAIRAILAVRELGKLRSSYFNCRYYTNPSKDVLYLTSYNVAGTLPGRRSSKKHAFGYGNNAQNFPKHGKLAKVFRKCLKARPGNILLNVDLKSADEWSVSALSNNMLALNELRTEVDRHTNFASAIFGIPIASQTPKQWKDGIQRYLGKKIRHGNNYGMKPPRMSDSLAQEGHSIPVDMCKHLLDKADSIEPMVKEVFHKYVQDQINTTRTLKTPFGRERQFLGMRPNDGNYKILNEGYAYIPASVTADITGFALYEIEEESKLDLVNRFIVNECHDSITFDVPVDLALIQSLCANLEQVYNITVRYYNGIEVVIPVEFELGFNMAEMETLKKQDFNSIKELIEKLQPPLVPEIALISEVI